jgi:bifunctional non-homologous end joining protein LigD
MARKPDSLSPYRRKRDFAKTTEPAGEVVRDREGWSFVVHKHDASHLHYDLRLELDGVLKSWAVPRGPSYDPADRRLAVQVEDHPLDYGGFEGVIPAGEYGGGTVMLWDRGTWTPEGDPRAGLAKGKLVFAFHGEKLRGTWHLARMRGKAAGKEDKPNWLLIKGKDDTAQPGLDPDDGEARSVLSGRTMAEIAAAADRVWSGETGEVATAAPADLPRARKAPFPRDLAPQLATLAREIPAGDGWLHEIKFDGYRLLAHVKNHRVKLITRGGKDWTAKFPQLAEALAGLPADAVVDGEATVVDAAGRTDFQALQNVLETGRTKDVVYFAFDLLYLDGYDLTRAPLADRKRALASLLAADPAKNGAIRFSDHLDGGGEAVRDQACRLGLEGIIAKRADAPYEQRRTRSWLKIKCGRRQEFVIGGYLASENRQGLRSLLLGVHQDDALIYAGKVGTGFDQSSLVSLARLLDRRAVKTPPFADAASIREKGVHWARPDLVCEIEFTEWTADGHLRHPSFKGLREDKDPAEVVREVPRAVNEPTKKSAKKKKKTTTPSLVTHPDRVLFPESGLTKGQLAAYYDAIADRLLPHVADRPLTLVRCPEGRHKQCFYQKNHRDDLPASVKAVTVPEKDGPAAYLTIDDRAGLLALVQLGAIELHPWGSRNDDLEHPDRLFFDLDPGPGVAPQAVAAAALLLRDLLADLGLASFAKTSGGKGYHVVVPIARRTGWDQLKAFTKAIADDLARTEPRRYVSVMTKAKREGKIFLDYLRNGRGATSVAAFSARARAGAPVSVPVSWQEIQKGVAPDAFTVENLTARLKRQRKDPWADYFTVRQGLTAAMMKAVMKREAAG